MLPVGEKNHRTAARVGLMLPLGTAYGYRAGMLFDTMNITDVIAKARLSAVPQQLLDTFNRNLPGMDGHLGFVYDYIGPTRVEAHIDVADIHRQPFGIVNGGIYCALAESTGSLLAIVATGRGAVGITNSTDFFRPVSDGTITATATVVNQGKTLSLIEVLAHADGRLVTRTSLKTFSVDD